MRQKEKDSRQKEKPHGKKKHSKQKENLTAKRKRLAAKFLRYREDILILISFAVRSWLFFLPWGYYICRELFLFAVRLILLPYLWNSGKFCSRRFMWVFVRTSMNFVYLTSFQAIEFMDWPVPKTLHISVCQTSENKAFTFCNCFSVTVFRPAKNENMI